MKQKPYSELMFQVFSLLICLIVVHAVYVTVVLPGANALLDEQRMQQETTGQFVAKRSIHIIMKDPEQEIEVILGLWVLLIIARKAKMSLRELKLLDVPLLEVKPGTSILAEDVRQYIRPLQALPDEQRETLPPRALMTALHRFGSTGNIQDVSTSIREVCETEADRLDSELSMIRYVIWAIPSIGFIGTVRGIGGALEEAHNAVQGDIVGVTVNLGTAFNSTLVALIISMLVMFLMHQLQLLQERLVLNTQIYCDVNLVRNLRTR
jgi:biopolymer transport protein ExbB/TolQ